MLNKTKQPDYTARVTHAEEFAIHHADEQRLFNMVAGHDYGIFELQPKK